MLATICYQSMKQNGNLKLSNNVSIERETAASVGLGQIFDKVVTELVNKMQEMNINLTELGCLKVIILYNAGN